MRLIRLLSLVVAIPLAACEITTGPGAPDAPTDLAYQLIPSGNPSAPAGVVLTWTPPRNGDALTYDVFGRSSQGAEWMLRATTTSPSFHDSGVPQLQYYVQARDGEGHEMGRSESITIDERNRLPAPLSLITITLDHAIQLSWADNAFTADPGHFDYYRVYSTTYDETRSRCADTWALDGTTISDGFLSANLQNGMIRCYAVSAVSIDGHESTWSEVRTDTPRYDARNVAVYAIGVRPEASGFLFSDDVAHTYGVVASGARTDLDFVIERRTDGSFWFRPGQSNVQMMLYSTSPVTDLTSIDRVPSTGFANVNIEALPGFMYLFRVTKTDGVHYGAVRVAYVGSDHVVFDWSYQSDAGNPDLLRAPRPRAQLGSEEN